MLNVKLRAGAERHRPFFIGHRPYRPDCYSKALSASVGRALFLVKHAFGGPLARIVGKNLLSCREKFVTLRPERRDRYLFQIEYEQLYNKEVKECLGKLENHQELVYIT